MIIAHTQPDGIVRLAQTIIAQSPNARVFVHYDASAGRFPSELIAGIPQVTLVDDPAKVSWGTFSQVEAVLRTLRQIRRDEITFDWAVLISGQDYPTRPIGDFEAMLRDAECDAIMTYQRITRDDRHFKDRYGFRYRRVLAGPLPRLLRARSLYDTVFNRIQPFIRVQTGPRATFIGWRQIRSVFHLRIPIYKGDQWWALSHQAIEVVLNTVRERPAFIKRYFDTLIPDESFFQTIVVNSPELHTANRSLHYAHWRSGNASPLFLTLDDLPAVRRSGRWFARKIDATNDGGLRDALTFS